MEKPRGFEKYLEDKESYKYHHTVEAFNKCEVYEEWLQKYKELIEKYKVHFGQAVACDFDENEATYEIEGPFVFKFGTYAILPREEFERLIASKQ